MEKIDIKKLLIPPPKGINARDLERPSWKSKDRLIPDYSKSSFELWLVVGSRDGDTDWFIPTLSIGGRRRGNMNPPRTYATRVKDGAGGYRIGRGPHVKSTLTVYVRQSRFKELEKFLTMREAGQEVAGQIRDRISSRLAQGQLMRAEGRSSWRWNT